MRLLLHAVAFPFVLAAHAAEWVSAEIDDPKGRRKGHVALPVHGGQDCLVYSQGNRDRW